MRALLALLLLANLGFLALSQGWLAPWADLSTRQQREPERLAAQFNAESVRVLDPAAAGVALGSMAPASGCLQAGPFDAAQVAAAEAALIALGIPAERWQRRRVDTPQHWRLVLGGFADSIEQARRQEALRREGFEVDALPETGATPAGLVLGRFDDKAGAEAAMTLWQQRGVFSATLVPPAAPSSAYWLRVDGVDAALRERLLRLPPIAPGAGYERCIKTP